MATKYDFHKAIIGRSEMLSFVDIGLHSIPAKVDTGAYRSAIHATSIHLDKQGTLSFDLMAGHPIFGGLSTHVETTNFERHRINSSIGNSEDRYAIKLKVKLGPKVFVTSFTLSDRSTKSFPILLGRTLISHRFLVDTSESSVNQAELREKYGFEFFFDEEERYEQLKLNPGLRAVTGPNSTISNKEVRP